MNFALLEMLYNIPELQDLSYQIYRQMPDRISWEKQLRQAWDEYEEVSTPELETLLDKLAEAEGYLNNLQECASFITGLHFGWSLSRTIGG